MKKVALFHPWDLDFFYKQTPGGAGIYKNFQFIINDSTTPVDLCIVWGGIALNEIKVKCPEGKLIYMTDEAHQHREFNQRFLDQFDAVIACRTDLKHKCIINTHETNTWHVPYSWDELYENDVPKSKVLSIVASDLTVLPGHKKRYAFVNRLIGHFKDKLDVFGRGFNQIDNKWLGLAPYKYSIAIENSSIAGYFTEKLSECYLAGCMPIYYGAPDINKYFDSETLLQIDIDDYKKSINLIEQLLDDDPYDRLKSNIIAQKHKYMENYHLYGGLSKLLDAYFNDLPSDKIKTKTIKAEKRFQKYYLLKKATKSVRTRLMNT